MMETSDYNIWDYALSEEEMIQWTSCKLPNLKGNVVDWNTAVWNTDYIESYDIENEASLCDALDLGPTLFHEKFDAQTFLGICNKVNGDIFVIKDNITKDLGSDLVFNNSNCINKDNENTAIWAGWSDQLNEGEFVSMNNPKIKFNFTEAWRYSEPNGDIGENCVLLENGYLNDYDCNKKQCGICDIKETPTFVMRGLCPETRFDYHYSWTGQLSTSGDKYNFSGFSNSHLYWDQNSTQWILKRDYMPDTYAVTNGSYPFGTQKWHFINDTCQDSANLIANDTYQVQISFISCLETSFNCDDGSW